MTLNKLARFVTASLVGALVLGASGLASAGGLENRAAAQRGRIEEAARTGRLAPRLIMRLRAREARLVRDITRARVRMAMGGRLPPRLRAMFDRRTAKLAFDITRALQFARRF